MEETKKRYFLFVYSYWTRKLKGKGNMGCSVVGGFPSKIQIEEKAAEEVSEQWNVPSNKVSIVIENWIEMTEQDFNDYDNQTT